MVPVGTAILVVSAIHDSDFRIEGELLAAHGASSGFEIDWVVELIFIQADKE